ncbi:MAG TPA: hypothetical protein VF488_01240, partial [Gemmatimonadaceae bacterium]
CRREVTAPRPRAQVGDISPRAPSKAFLVELAGLSDPFPKGPGRSGERARLRQLATSPRAKGPAKTFGKSFPKAFGKAFSAADPGSTTPKDDHEQARVRKKTLLPDNSR